MTEEEYFRKNNTDFCYGEKPLSPYWDLFQDGVEFGERQSEKKIEELEKENKDLRDNYDQFKAIAEPEIERLKKENAELKEQRFKAKEIIEELLSWERRADYDYAEYDLIKDKAEQFLKEIEK